MFQLPKHYSNKHNLKQHIPGISGYVKVHCSEKYKTDYNLCVSFIKYYRFLMLENFVIKILPVALLLIKKLKDLNF